jgi:deazaflavin-dependent oxidoreductase (nitroreductase family)
LPRALGRFNRYVTNPILWLVVRWLPGYGRMVHVGRRSGRVYRTPVLAFRRGDRVRFALTYGPGTDWARNVLAAGRATLEQRGEGVELIEPRLFRDPSHRDVPAGVRAVLRAIRASDYLELRIASRTSGS